MQSNLRIKFKTSYYPSADNHKAIMDNNARLLKTMSKKYRHIIMEHRHPYYNGPC